MKLSDIISRKFLPSIQNGKPADRLNWMCNAFDTFVKTADTRRLALAAPIGLDAIQKLTDAELQQYYSEFNLATYYPDLPRESRNQFLFEQMLYYRKLGTIAAMQAMIQYIFGNNPISLTIIDNLAFDGNGVLTDDSLLNMYDAVVNVENPTLGEYELNRIFSNLTKFGRNSQKLRGISLNFNPDATIPLDIAACTNGDCCEIAIENYAICEAASGDVYTGYLTRVGINANFIGSMWMRNADGSWQEIPGFNALWFQKGQDAVTFLSMTDTNNTEYGVGYLSVGTVDGTGNMQVTTAQEFNSIEKIVYQVNW